MLGKYLLQATWLDEYDLCGKACENRQVAARYHMIRRLSFMRITDVRVRKMTQDSKMKAIVSITIDDEFVVHDIKVIEGEKGLFIAMPSKKANDGEYRDIAHPINSETRDRIQRIILDSYEKALLEPNDEQTNA